MTSERRPLPPRQLPVAFIKISDPGGVGTDRLAEVVAGSGGLRLDSDLFAITPRPGRGAIFEIAATLAQEVCAAPGKGLAPGFLLFPGRIDRHERQIELVREALLDRVQNQALPLAPGRLTVTGHVARWLRGAFEQIKSDPVEIEEGRRVPTFFLGQRPAVPQPWHNVDVLGRQPLLERSELQLEIAACLEVHGVVRVRGAVGVGKTRLAAQVAGPAALWWSCAIGQRGLMQLDRLLESHPGRDQAGRSVLVVDDLDGARAADLDALARLIEHRAGAYDLIIIENCGSNESERFGDLPVVTVPALNPEETEILAEMLTARLELRPRLHRRWVEVSAGYPLALEEGLLDLAQRGLMRRVYGSFFYAGGDDVEIEPSLRLSARIQAGASLSGPILALELLAQTEEKISPSHVLEACEKFGVELGWDWHRPFISAGWLRLEDGTLRFVCPAYRQVFAASISKDGARSLRHALGGVLADTEQSAWSAYRLLAGSPQALPSLLDFTRESSDRVPREEVYNALYEEYRQHCDRRGDGATELEILWRLLPMARRMGCLGLLEAELNRAIELAGKGPRYVALVALRAEHDQDRGRFREAEIGLRAALGASRGLDALKRALLMVRLGALLHRQERLNEARDLFEKLLPLLQQQGSWALVATSFFHLGNIALAERKLEAAAKHHRAAADLRREHNQFRALGSSFAALSVVALAQGEIWQALTFAEQAENASLDSGDPADLPFALTAKGRALAALGDATTALVTLRRALELRQGQEDQLGEMVTRIELAARFAGLGQLEAALAEARRCVFHLALLPRLSLRGQAARLFGQVLARQGQLEEAAQRVIEALKLHQEQGDRHEEALDLAALIEIELRRQRWPEVYQFALALERALDGLAHPSQAELCYFALFRAFESLERSSGNQNLVEFDPRDFLRKAYRELWRKTTLLPPQLRNKFLTQVSEHQDLVNAATKHNLSMPMWQISREELLAESPGN
jgi:tetratricopeptide (TPR) repeat protein